MAKIVNPFKNNINVHPSKIGPERRKEILDGIANKGTYLPRGIGNEDMDETFIDFVKNGLQISLDGVRVPVIFLTIQRWSEYTKTWKFTEAEYKDITIPFITIVRKPDIQVGTNQAGLWNIPGGRTYTYMKVPTFDGSRSGVDLYKIPQPTSVDISYEVRIFTNRLRDLNSFNTIIQKAFQARQSYINVKGHPMPVTLESISDESNIDDFENRRFYIQLFEMKLAGYILDEKDFEVMPTINRIHTLIEVDGIQQYHKVILDEKVVNNTVTYTFVFKPSSEASFTFTSKYATSFTQLVNVENISRITIAINNVTVFDGLTIGSPIIMGTNDQIMITIYKRDLVQGSFQLIGNTI